MKKRPVFRGFVTFSISKPGLKLMTLPVNSNKIIPEPGFYPFSNVTKCGKIVFMNGGAQ